ncbi:MAG: phosphorylase [Bacteroidales bacterium]|nr:phosphorylase [Bacteroidales bacterium]
MDRIAESELIINGDGTIFHLHLKPENIAENIIVVGDPQRVEMVAQHFGRVEFEGKNREFRTITGIYKGKRVTALSHGIGGGCIDIVVTELDALANMDFKTRRAKSEHKTLNIVRVGTCGGLQPDTPIGTYICSDYSIGFDSLLNFYAAGKLVSENEITESFIQHTNWIPECGRPYCIKNSSKLIERIAQSDMVHGITCSAGGFYAPQGRVVRAELAMPQLNSLLQSFIYNSLKITNFEMEGAQLAGLAKILGHNAMTVCMVVANRFAKDASTDYKSSMEGLVKLVLDRI